MKRRIALSLMGVFLIQGIGFIGAAMADDDDFHDAIRHEREANKNQAKAAEARAEAKYQSRRGHGLRAKWNRMKAKHYKEEAREDRHDAKEDMHDAIHDD
ncbi:hypothetical protein KF728_23005 [Candidatus Obscuribacterales bacterium]|nr:hypothetical protein [Candidatus Obscuribacterales bacterium]